MRTRTPQKLVYVALQEASKKRKKGCTKGTRENKELLFDYKRVITCFMITPYSDGTWVAQEEPLLSLKGLYKSLIRPL